MLAEAGKTCYNTAMKDYRFTLTIPVIFHDLDAMGHVNNVVYLTYFETARIAYYSIQ